MQSYKYDYHLKFETNTDYHLNFEQIEGTHDEQYHHAQLFAEDYKQCMKNGSFIYILKDLSE
jgi:hypothetical protein